MESLDYTDSQKSAILKQLQDAGLFVDQSSSLLQALTRDFWDAPQHISTLLIQDFGLSPLVAHQSRAALVHHHQKQEKQQQVPASQTLAAKPETPIVSKSTSTPSNDNTRSKPLLYKQVVVNEQAKQRKKPNTTKSSVDSYGLPRNYASLYPTLSAELDQFMTFMTQPVVDSQGEDPIRSATAEVYMRHAKLFLGWYTSTIANNTNTSLYEIIPNQQAESAKVIIDFLLWLRTHRQISVSYEANLLRGLVKFLKFRFRSVSNSSDNDKTFDDIAVIRQVRKLHRDANKRQAVAPRSSQEDRKWLSWPDFLQVVQRAKQHVEQLMAEYDDEIETDTHEIDFTPQQRKIAVAYQKYLILALFANVPDRQRTIRELELGRSFIRQDETWCIRHQPDDYKTGKTYGERPPLHLSHTLTPAMDDFLQRWRPCLLREQKHDFVFLQSRTGRPLTQDSVYQLVGRTCYAYTGQRTNPHLLRDMIVTHVRESPAVSEHELEALALFMGHSVHVQRASYDRRTLRQKVAPAVALLESVNNNSIIQE